MTKVLQELVVNNAFKNTDNYKIALAIITQGNAIKSKYLGEFLCALTEQLESKCRDMNRGSKEELRYWVVSDWCNKTQWKDSPLQIHSSIRLRRKTWPKLSGIALCHEARIEFGFRAPKDKKATKNENYWHPEDDVAYLADKDIRSLIFSKLQSPIPMAEQSNWWPTYTYLDTLLRAEGFDGLPSSFTSDEALLYFYESYKKDKHASLINAIIPLFTSCAEAVDEVLSEHGY